MKSTYDTDQVLHLHENCVITPGYSRAIIHNLSKNTFDLVPLALTEVIELLDNEGITATYGYFGEDNEELVSEYIRFLLERGYGRICNREDFLYKNRSAQVAFKNWATPLSISSFIFDYSQVNAAYLEDALTQLGELGCHTIQLRFFHSVDLFLIKQVLDFATRLERFYGVSLVVNGKDLEARREEGISELIEVFPILTEIIVYNTPKSAFHRDTNRKVNILFIEGQISAKSCGAVQSFYFNATNTHYAESLQHNTCLNRKVAIDQEGQIKNCPSMMESFGNIRDTSLKIATSKPEFRKYWTITKEQVTKCKDCEFRHICTDCRAFLDKPDDIYSAPLKCGYDPYTCEWEAWSTHPLKQAAINYYAMAEQ